MEVLSVKNLSFQYDNNRVLDHVEFQVQQGEMILLCGPCGCGKTTLLRLLKEEICPQGYIDGEITTVYESSKIGYLFQNPESQIVCGTVEEELVFGAENLGMDREQIARSVAEISAYLGIESILHRNTAELSGGQKQILNLASLLMMNPKFLLLDEPISQLDPVCTYDFMNLIKKIREDLNITIIVVEHNLERFLWEADKILYMENGRILYEGMSGGFMDFLFRESKPFRYSLPEVVKLYQKYFHENYSASARELFVQLSGMSKKQISSRDKQTIENTREEVLKIKSGYFRYEKESEDILKDLNVTFRKGHIYGIAGGNGVGKSTLFSVLSGYRKLYRGKCIVKGKIGILPQNPVYAFFKDSLWDDLLMIAKKEKIEEYLERYDFCEDIKKYLNQNPLDLSGGQMQKAAIFKLLLGDSNILLMDEPVKSMDGYEKYLFTNVLEQLRMEGKTILFISHDLEFIQESADLCLFMFEGKIIAKGEPAQIFQKNRFYTTVLGRLRGMWEDD